MQIFTYICLKGCHQRSGKCYPGHYVNKHPKSIWYIVKWGNDNHFVSACLSKIVRIKI